MAIVKMDKFNLLAFDSDRENLLNILQDFNYVHFNDLLLDNDEDYLTEIRATEKLAQIDESINKVDYVIKLIEDYNKNLPDELNNQESEMSIEEVNKKGSNFGFDLIYEKLKELVTEREKLVNAKENLSSKIYDLSPWKDIDINIDKLYNSCRFFLETGSISSRFYQSLQEALVERGLDGSLVYKISEREGNYYVVAVSTLALREEFEEVLREYGFSKVKIGADENISTYLTSLSDKKDQKDTEIEKIDEQIRGFRKYLSDLYIYQSYVRNQRKKEESSENFLKTRQMNVIEGYVPSDKTDTFKAYLDKALGEKYILDVKAAEKDDPNVPIILKNNKLIEPYESVVETYSLPKYSELDPTSIVAIFYTIFTGFMIGDLGYGLLGVIAILLALKFKLFPKSKEQTLKLFLRISISACVFGFIFGSVFGGIIDVPFGWVDTQNDIDTLITMSLIIGGISLFFALGVKGLMEIRDGHPDGLVFDVISWYMAVGGAIALALTKNPIAKYIMIAGMVMIVLFAGRAMKSWPARIASGAYELYGITSWIGDFVSFLRLMALVLSGGFVAYSVNLIVGMMVGDGVGGLIGGIIVFVVFQIFNMFLSYLSAYVHSLRLIYVEMFNKFYEGGGIKFREMVEDTNFINIIRKGEK